MKMCIVSSRSRVWQFYYRRWQVVLCFSPVGSTLRVRSRKFPAVTNCTAIDWFHEWPQEALVSVSKRFIDDLEQLEVRRIFFTNFYIRELLAETMIMIWMEFCRFKTMSFLSAISRIRFQSVAVASLNGLLCVFLMVRKPCFKTLLNHRTDWAYYRAFNYPQGKWGTTRLELSDFIMMASLNNHLPVSFKLWIVLYTW